MNVRASMLLLAGALISACASSSDRRIVGPRHVAASSGAPKIKKVVDLGTLYALPAKGSVPTAESDGTFVVGELILIEGDDFGKLPTIAIDGRPMKSLARTKGGGIIARIPAEVSAGSVEVEVSHPDGRDRKAIELERFLATAGPSAVHFARAMSNGRLELASSLALGGVKDLCFGQDGSVLYAARPKERKLASISMASKGGPALGADYSLSNGEFIELVCRTGVPVVAVLGRKKVSFYDARVPTAISKSGEVVLPDGAVAAALSPDGAALAVLGSKGNRLSLIAINTLTVVATIELLDNETAPLLRDLVFAPAGDEIWVLSGNSAASMVVGTRPTRIHRVAIHGISLARAGTAQVGLASGPRFLAVSEREAIMAAAAIRSTASRATLIMSSTSPGALAGDGAQGESAKNSLLRFDLEGKASTLVEGEELLSKTAVSHDQSWGYAAARSNSELVLVHTSLTQGASEVLRLGAEAPKSLDEPIPLAIAP